MIFSVDQYPDFGKNIWASSSENKHDLPQLPFKTFIPWYTLMFSTPKFSSGFLVHSRSPLRYVMCLQIERLKLIRYSTTKGPAKSPLQVVFAVPLLCDPYRLLGCVQRQWRTPRKLHNSISWKYSFADNIVLWTLNHRSN